MQDQRTAEIAVRPRELDDDRPHAEGLDEIGLVDRGAFECGARLIVNTFLVVEAEIVQHGSLVGQGRRPELPIDRGPWKARHEAVIDLDRSRVRFPALGPPSS